MLTNYFPCLALAVADTGDVVLSLAVKRHLSEEDVVAAVGQLGDNTLAPAGIDVSELQLDEGAKEGGGGQGGMPRGGGKWQ
jgi:hypothetical protein